MPEVSAYAPCYCATSKTGSGRRNENNLSAANSSSNPRRISAAVQNRADTNYLRFYTVIDRKGKALTQCAMISKNFGVNAAYDSQCVNIGQDRFAKIASKTGRLVFIEAKSGDQILLRFRQDLDPHEVRRRISAFAFSQSTNFVSPDSTFRSRSANSSWCHGGDSMPAGSAERLCQSASMVCSFSSTLISFSGRIGTLIAQIISHSPPRSTS